MSENKISLKGKVCLVTGANRGIGLEVCRRLAQLGGQVILTCRDKAKGQVAVEVLQKEGLSVDFFSLDVTQDTDVHVAQEYVSQKYGCLDVLINNAGILPDNLKAGEFSDRSILEIELPRFFEAFDTNAMGALRLCRAFVPLMKKNRFGRIVNVSSLVAQLSTMDSGIPAYRISKVALNSITRILADELREFSILVNSVSPGWVKSDMGGPQASDSLSLGAERIVNLAIIPKEGPTGLFFRDGKAIDW